MKDQISTALLEARKASGLTQKQLSEVSGINEAAISHYENARREPTVPSLRSLADALGVSIDSLAGGKNVTQAKMDSAKRWLRAAADDLHKEATKKEIAAARRGIRKASRDLEGCR